MNENNQVKISLTTLFLIIAVILIIVMGCFIFFLYNDYNNQNNEIKELKTAMLENETEQLQVKSEENTTTKTNNVSTTMPSENVSNVQDMQQDQTISETLVATYESLCGKYVTSAESKTGETGEIILNLNSNGTFSYNYEPGFETKYEGYYTINENSIVLYVLLSCGNDIGATLSDKIINLEINDDSSLTDNSELNITLNKSSSDTVDVNLTDEIVTRLQQDVLSY